MKDQEQSTDVAIEARAKTFAKSSAKEAINAPEDPGEQNICLGCE